MSSARRWLWVGYRDVRGLARLATCEDRWRRVGAAWAHWATGRVWTEWDGEGVLYETRPDMASVYVKETIACIGGRHTRGKYVRLCSRWSSCAMVIGRQAEQEASAEKSRELTQDSESSSTGSSTGSRRPLNGYASRSPAAICEMDSHVRETRFAGCC